MKRWNRFPRLGNFSFSEKQKYAVVLTVNTVLCTAVYFVLNALAFWPIFWIYAVLLTGSVLAYLICNRGFSRQGVTAEMLPVDWTEERKQQFLRERDDRLQRSKWILTVVIPLLVAFFADFLYLMIEK